MGITVLLLRRSTGDHSKAERESMLTRQQEREVVDLVNALSGSLLVEQGLIVEAIRENDDIHGLIYKWLTRGGVDYSTIVQAFGEVF